MTSTVFLGLIILYNLTLIWLLFTQGRKAASASAFALLIVSATLWAGTILVTDLLHDHGRIAVWSRLSFTTSALVVWTLYRFVGRFPVAERRRVGLDAIMGAATVAMVALSLTDRVVVRYETGGTIFGWGQPAFLGFMLLGFGASLTRLVRKARGLRGTVEAQQLRYITLGVSLSIGLAIATNAVLPLLGIAEIRFLGPLAMVGFLTATTYAIVRHRLMDLRLILRGSAVYGALSLFCFLVYYVVVWIDTQVFGGVHTAGAYLSALVLAPAFLLTFSYVHRAIRRVANRYFFASLYDGERVVRAFAARISATIRLSEVASVIAETIGGAIHTEKIALVVPASGKTLDRVVRADGYQEADLAAALADGPGRELLLQRRGPVLIDELPDLQQPVRERLRALGIAAAVPLVSKGAAIGHLLLGPKVSEDAYTKEDVELLATLGNQAAIAVENARLYNSMEEIVAEQTGEIRRQNEQLEALLQMKSEFLSIASHQLRTPLTAIRGLLSMQAEGDFDRLPPEEVKRQQQNMLASANRLANIVNDLLDAMELEGGLTMTFEPTDLKEMIEDICQELKPNYDRKGLSLTVKGAEPALRLVPVEKKMLREAIENLIDNAEKYTNDGGTTVTLSARDGRAVIEVRDTGIGIPKSDFQRLFKKFSRGEKSSYQHTDGSGLGLFIARNVLSGHHGTIDIASDGEGKGTTVTVTLPLTQPKGEHEETAS